jgi:hypothetical protein
MRQPPRVRALAPHGGVVSCARFFLTSAVLGAACTTLAASLLPAQAPVPPGSPVAPPAMLAPYRAPLIALVQPPLGGPGAGSVPQDRPVVVFRFAAGEADDPLDVRSFVVAVDGVDRTTLFQTTATQAWGALAADEAVARGQLSAGAHRVAARICSARGACGSTEAQVLVVPGVVRLAPADSAAPVKGLARKALGAVLSATRKLLQP